MTATARLTLAVLAAEVVSTTAVLVVLAPPLVTAGITSFGVWFLGGTVLVIHTLGRAEQARGATVVSLLAAAMSWAVVHVDTGGGARQVVLTGLLLWVAEEARDLSVTFSRPGHTPGAVTAARVPRYLGITAASLGADALLVALLRDPPVSGWIWRIVGAAALLVLLAAARPRAPTGS